ncbi:hypothetical protein CEP54_002920 [Fusarium duplospermum]|uniref:Pyruvate decarboxylase n=1 Tax=Fusarium duplospermum TaxID=1325734 RepID=A0A428QS12_9HYPO|nr:hypothetical protein CEP54_002920 [Fusarium duplospermum]
MAPHVDLAEYLWIRLAQLGLGSIHGVPGDYNLTVLDYLKSTGIHWVGNANELNAGYAADGYARVKGIGALITSFGVGELSAINAIAGAYSERVPVVHIIGTPSLSAQKAEACLHHSLGDGNFRLFANMYKMVTVDQANLTDPSTAPRMIDATLKECLRQSRPVYIQIPCDMVKVKVLAPASPIILSLPKIDESFERDLVHRLATRIQNSKKPMILADAFAGRFGMKDEINQLVKLTGFPTLTTLGGKGLVNESLPNFHGSNLGLSGDPAQQVWAKSRDLVLRFGPLDSDANTFGSTAIPDARITVTFEKYSIRMGGKDVPSGGNHSLPVKSILRKLVAQLKACKLPIPEPYPEKCISLKTLQKMLLKPEEDSIIDQYSFWLRVSNFIREGDIVMAETGTATHGSQSLILPDDTVFINSSIWLSIGYTLAACQGAALAQKEVVEDGTRRPGRTILFEGDGSFQMTAQAISDIIRNKLDVIIFVLNNSGYTIERLIHGPNENYNDIQAWRILEAPSYFGASKDDPSYPVRTFLAENWGQLGNVLDNPGLKDGKGLNMIEVKMEMDDAPKTLRTFVDRVTRKINGGGA